MTEQQRDNTLGGRGGLAMLGVLGLTAGNFIVLKLASGAVLGAFSADSGTGWVGSGSSRGHRERFAPPSPRSTRHFMTQLGCRSKGPSGSGAIALDPDQAREGRCEIETPECLAPARATSPRSGPFVS